MNKSESISLFIKHYPKKHKEGYANTEIIGLCKHYGINPSRVYELLFQTTGGVEVRNGDMVYDEDAIYKAFTSVL
jgi:hypothetical protein